MAPEVMLGRVRRLLLLNSVGSTFVFFITR